MAERISTCLQSEVGRQQKELKRIESKFDGKVNQIRSELEQLGTDMRRMFEQIMSKMDATNTGKKPAESVNEGSRIDSSEFRAGQFVVTVETEVANDSTSKYYQHGRLECLRFEGEDFEWWLMKVKQYFEMEKVSDENKGQ